MFSYKDMTFCQFHNECNDSESCHRALTEKVLQDAKKWWNNISPNEGEPPICMYSDTPHCFVSSIQGSTTEDKIQ